MALLLVVGPNAADVPFPLFFGLLGFLSGVTFSGFLGLVEGRRRFDQMSLPRFAGWGALGGGLLAGGLALLTGQGLDIFVLLSGVFGASGAVCASGTLALARMAEDSELLESGSGIDEVGLTAEEKRELLGGGG
jgi:hypothetical protein